LTKYQDDGILTKESKVFISCFEIYKQELQDLLYTDNKTSQYMTNGKFEAHQVKVDSKDDVEYFIESSQKNRTSGTTNLNL